jgi:transglutaminase-like putative cysteine protease
VRYNIIHTTTYAYNQPVWLKPHLIRLQPRHDYWQKVHSFSVIIDPQPETISEIIDLDGNNVMKIWFTQATQQLDVKIMSQVETCKTNPFDYLLEPWAIKLPIDYPSSLLAQLQPYLQTYSHILDPVVLELAQEIELEVKGNTIAFVSSLNQRIYEHCAYITRETGEPWQSGVTWRRKQGSCRDLAILFMEACRAMGLATRFVSGYQEGDVEQDNRDLHAWAEVYLPGGGWRGYDPTHGLAVSDRHVALAASAIPSYAAAVTGHITPVKSFVETGEATHSQITAEILIQVI